MKEEKAKSKIVKAEKEITKVKEEIKAKEKDDKQVHKNELSAEGKLKSAPGRKKPEHTVEFENAKGYVDHVIEKNDELRTVVRTPVNKREWVKEDDEDTQKQTIT